MDNTNLIASKYLGKKTDECKQYDSALLVAIPRCENRKQYNLKDDDLPFDGADIWHVYEFSCMTENGIPVTKVLKLKYSAKSEFLIESKSLKLYFNSFNMMKYGKNIQECLEICKTKIEQDLSATLQTKVKAVFLHDKTRRIEIFKKFNNIMNYIDEEQLKITEFKEAPHLLEVDENQKIKKHYLTFKALRSNCRVTHQPDFGDVFIYYKSLKHIKEDSLVKYLTSFRSEYHFHEECCEMIYKRLYDLLNENDELLVCALYTRRGGIDICPARWSKSCNTKEIKYLVNINKFARNGMKQ